LDSDIEIMVEDGLQKIIDTYLENSENENCVMSISPFHKVRDLYEELSAIFNIIMTGSMNAFTPHKKAKPNGLFGPAMIVSRENYFKINGHESVKNKILENMFMAEIFKKEGIGLKCFGGFGSLSFRMYNSGIKDLVNGWSKAFASGAGQISFFSLLNIILWISGGFIITSILIFSLFSGTNAFIWFLLYLAFTSQIFWMLKRIGSFRIISAILFPGHLVFFCVIFTRSLIYKKLNKSIQWKSRDVKS
jgi:4,4'-diaponeurosporenoate glycosyltransferase